MSDRLLERIKDELKTVQVDINELEATNKNHLQNIYLDVDDINVANETLEKLIGGNDGSFTYGLNDLLASSNTKIDTVNTSVGSTNTKLDTIDSVLDNLLVDTTAMKTSLNALDNAISGNELQVDIVGVSTIATESTVGDIKTELESIDTHLANLEYGSGSEWYVKTKNNDILVDGSTAPSNTPFLPIGGVDANGNSQVLKTSSSGNLMMSVEGAVITDTVRLLSGEDSGSYPQIGTVGIVAGTASIGKVELEAGTSAIGSVTVTSAPTTAVTNSALTSLGSAINSNKLDVDIKNTSIAVTGTVTSTPSGTQAVSNSGLTELATAIVTTANADQRNVSASTDFTGIQIHHPSLAKFDYALDLLHTEAKFNGSTQYRVVSTNIMNRDLAVTHDALTELGTAINSDKLDVNVTNTVPVSGTFWQTTQPVSIAGTVEVVQDTSADLKVTEANSSTISTRINSVNSAVNNVNSSISATNSKIDTLDGSVDAVKTSVDAIKGNGTNDSTLYDLKGVLDSIDANTDTLEVKVAEVDVNTDGLEALQTTTNTKLDTAITAVGKIDDVHGTDGSTAPTKGNLIGGKDGSGNFQDLLVDTSGRASVNINGTVPVSGTVTATPSGTQPVSGTVTANVGTGTQAVSHGALTELESSINSNKLDINIASGGFDGAVTGTFWQTTQPVSGTVTETNSGAIKTAVEKLDNAISGSEMQVDVVTMPTTAVTGTFWQTTQPVSGTVAVTNSGLTELANAISGNEMQVDVLTMPTITETNSSAIDTKLGTVNTNLGTLETSTDGIRGSGSNVKNLYDLHGVLATINTSASTTATKTANLDNISTKSNNIATSAGAINSDTTSMSNKLTTIDSVLDEIETANTVGSAFTNGSTTIGTSSAQMTSTSFTCNKGVTITADMSNQGTIYVGNATGVTSSTGFPLEAGDAMFLPIANPTLVYIIADTASQKVLYIAI